MFLEKLDYPIPFPIWMKLFWSNAGRTAWRRDLKLLSRRRFLMTWSETLSAFWRRLPRVFAVTVLRRNIVMMITYFWHDAAIKCYRDIKNIFRVIFKCVHNVCTIITTIVTDLYLKLIQDIFSLIQISWIQLQISLMYYIYFQLGISLIRLLISSVLAINDK